MLKKNNLIPILCLVFAGGILVGRYVFSSRPAVEIFESSKIHPAVSKYAFVNPLIGFDIAGKKEFLEFSPLKNQVNGYIHDMVAQAKAHQVSVYFRNVSNGHWVGIDEDRLYEPASLLKVPVMIAYFKAAEDNPDILKKKIYYNQPASNDHPRYVIEDSRLVINRTYAADDLIRSMIIDSDNNALQLLADNINLGYLKDLFSDLGVALPSDSPSYGISAKTYSLFFRTLYNATMLDWEMSDRALDLLSQTTFHNGLVKGLPADVRVSHKYGEHGIYDEHNVLQAIQLHDCGIIYHSVNPYFLCIMTQGSRLEDLEQVIQEISRKVYESVNSQVLSPAEQTSR